MKQPLIAWFAGILFIFLVTALMVQVTSIQSATDHLSFVAAVMNDADDLDEHQGAISWQHLSSKNGDLPSPAGSPEQTAALILDVDKDGVKDFIIATRKAPGPSVIWFRRESDGWARYIIESQALRIEAGGTFYDIDGDGDLDVVFGRDSSGVEIWWWENPYPNFSPTTNWTRRLIKTTGCAKQHDMLFSDVDGNGKAELVFWNQSSCTGQQAGQLFRAEIPDDVKSRTTEWPRKLIYASNNTRDEGLVVGDIDLDGLPDIVAGGAWFKYEGGDLFERTLIQRIDYPRMAVADLIPGGRPEIVQVPGDVAGMARWYQWNGSTWVGHDLLDVRNGHSLEIADIDQDGHLDIFIGEMRQIEATTDLNPDARTMILYGDGQGDFELSIVTTGIGQHESKMGDLDGDGDLDILGKPYIWDTPRVDVWLNQSGGPVATPTIAPTSDSCQPLDSWQTHFIDNARPWRAIFIDSVDLDGDGFEDIVTGAWWYRNPGTAGGTWTRQPIDMRLDGATSPVTNTFNQFVVKGDFDGDGLVDLLGTKWAGGTSNPEMGLAFIWARNNGNGTFEIIDANASAVSGDFLQGAAVAYFQPGKPEIVLSWHQESLARLDSLVVPDSPQTQSWSVRTLTTVTQSEEVNVADIDGDGDQDILLGTVWLENQGNGQSWADHRLFSTTEKPDRNRLADIDGDGRLDAVVDYEAANSGVQPLAWYSASANWTQPWKQIVIDQLVAPMSLDVADADGDGDFDIVVGEHHLTNPASGRVLVYENVNNGASWVTHLVATGHEHHDGTQFVDVDNDGDLDIISIGWTHGNVLLYEQLDCEPSSTPTATSPAPATPTATAEASKTPTVTPAACQPTATKAIGDMTWSRHVIDPDRPGRASFVFTFDVDGDGLSDILTGKYWYRNPGMISGTWTRTLLSAPLEDLIAVYDFDGDGDLDLFGTSGSTMPVDGGYWAPFVWGRNEGNGIFTTMDNIDNAGFETMPANKPIQGVAIARYHPDGPLEIAVTWDDTERPNRNPFGIQMFTLPANPSQGQWTRRTLSTFSLGEEISAVDLDNDGDMDLFLGFDWLRNEYPSNSWTRFTIHVPTSGETDRHALFDIDEDGDLDVVIGYGHDPERKLAWYEQPSSSPTNTWTERMIANLPTGFAVNVELVDMDGDGDMDVVSGGFRPQYSDQTELRPSSVWIFENLGQGQSWRAHEVYYGDSHYQSTMAVDLDNDGDLDIISKGWLHFRVHVYENDGSLCTP
ncbi:MAG: VCBS repeat-containing protein [Chloroflexota bacterium]